MEGTTPTLLLDTPHFINSFGEDKNGELYITTSSGQLLKIATTATTTIQSLEPSSVNAGSGAFTLTVNGTGFINGSVVRWNGQNRPTTFVSANKLTAQIPASDIQTAGTYAVSVFTLTFGDTSNSVNFTVNNCSYSLSSTSQNIVAAGSNGSFSLTTSNNSCSWTAASNVPWIAITGGSGGTGNGTVNFSVSANTGAARTGTITAWRTNFYD